MLLMIIIIITILLTCIYHIYKEYKYEQFRIRYQNLKKQENMINNRITKDEKQYTIKDTFNYNKYYRPKRYVITLTELKFYTVLMEIAKELDLIVFSQVSLYNIIQTRENLDFKTKTTYFNKIASKSIDFILVNKLDCKIKLCIELDDRTHTQRKRIERDKFINELFSDLGINLLRYPVYNVYYKETLKTRIIEKMK